MNDMFLNLESRMRAFENNVGATIPDGNYVVVRIDGKGFSKLTRQKFNKPYDERFQDIMVEVTKFVMEKSGFKINYAYTQSDEISFLFSVNEKTYNKKVRKINSLMASYASARFSLMIGEPVVFDSRVIALPTERDLLDYFNWRQQDAQRNAINNYCYWTLRDKNELSPRTAQKELDKKSFKEKVELLSKYHIDYDKVPLVAKNGVGFYYISVEKVGFNPITRVAMPVYRNKLIVDRNLGDKELYKHFVKQFINKDSN